MDTVSGVLLTLLPDAFRIEVRQYRFCQSENGKNKSRNKGPGKQSEKPDSKNRESESSGR